MTSKRESAGIGARPNPAQRYGSIAEIGVYLGYSDRHIRDLIAEGLLPAYRVGPRSIRIAFEDADALLEPIPTVKAG